MFFLEGIIAVMRVIIALFVMDEVALLQTKDPADALRLMDNTATSAFDVETILQVCAFAVWDMWIAVSVCCDLLGWALRCCLVG